MSKIRQSRSSDEMYLNVIGDRKAIQTPIAENLFEQSHLIACVDLVKEYPTGLARKGGQRAFLHEATDHVGTQAPVHIESEKFDRKHVA